MSDDELAMQVLDWLRARRVEVEPTGTGHVVRVRVWPDGSRFSYTFPVARDADRRDVIDAYMRCLEALT